MKIKKFLLILLAVLFAAAIPVSCGDKENGTTEDKSRYGLKSDMKTDGQIEVNGGLSFPKELWTAPESERYDSLDKGRAKGYFIGSYNGNTVFCYVGIPENASETEKVPGVVLVHGGGGTAFYEWVNFWVARGYAAIAMDTEGMMPGAQSTIDSAVRVPSIKKHGPANTAFADYQSPVEEQWAYHGICAVISSNSFLRSFKEVDEGRIGITGISYGAFLTWQAAAYDDRYVFVAPVYGSPEQKEGDTEFGKIMRDKDGAIGKLWDDGKILEGNKTPFLWYNGNKDRFFSVPATSASDKITEQSTISLKYNLAHGHTVGGLQAQEVFAFADQICLNEKGLIKVLAQPAKDRFAMEIAVPQGVNVERVTAFYTLDTVFNENTSWKFSNGGYENGIAGAALPGNAKAFYIVAEDDRGFEVSSQLIFL